MAKKIYLFLIISVALAGGLAAAKVKIEKIEYSNLNGYVQLFLPTNQILPIPETLYPDPGNRNKIVMRVRDAECLTDATPRIDHSPLIQSIRISNNVTYSDIEIILKKEVAPRLFSDQQGVYIEFPFDGGSTVAYASIPPATAVRPSSNPSSTMVTLKDILVKENTEQGISFEIMLSGKTDYSFVPLPDNPARLAIDLKNTTAKPISKAIHLQNIKAIRGARNSSSVYRVVFDLETLGNYKVTSQDQSILVQFFKGLPSADLIATNTVPPPSDTEKKTVATAEASSPPIPTETMDEASPGVSNLISSPVPLQPENEKKTIAKPAEKPKEFFGEEKARTASERMAAGIGTVTVQDERGVDKTQFVTQTVAEGTQRFSGEPYDFSFKNADLVDVLKFIARTANLNIAIDPGVSGKITCDFVQVPWDQALDIFLKLNKLDMLLEGNVLRIGPVGTMAEEAKKRRELQDARAEEQPLVVVTRAISYAQADQLFEVLKKNLSKRGEMIVDKRTNQLIITDVASRISSIDKLIDILDVANPQVQIEARIVEVLTDFLRSFGIQWGYDLIANPALGNQTNLVFPNQGFSTGYLPEGTAPNKYKVGDVTSGFAINTPAADTMMFPFLRLGNIANTFNLDVALSGMERKGKGKVISAPKATTQSMFPAKIQQGERIPIQTLQNNTVTTQYINATLSLEVVPQITARGSVLLTVKLTNDTANFEKAVNNMPVINTESAETMVMVNDGGTIAIGGMYKLTQSTTTSGVPLLSRLPLLGGLFRNQRRSNEQRELVIFITPRVLK